MLQYVIDILFKRLGRTIAFSSKGPYVPLEKPVCNSTPVHVDHAFGGHASAHAPSSEPDLTRWQSMWQILKSPPVFWAPKVHS